MNYVAWAVTALFAYAFVAPLTAIALEEIPTAVVVLTTNTMLIGAVIVLLVVTDSNPVVYLTHDRAPYMYAAGVCLAVGIIAYYEALSTGPVSVVVPIFGLFIALSSVIGIVALGEELTPRKAVGIALALVAIYLTAVE